ncbi:MAG: spore coat protein CotJB [Bacillota bacterium]|nr:spore coat protein CotJB [Bacillota bacterium]
MTNSTALSGEQAEMMLNLQQIGLTITDLIEYLDTHPYDSFAIARFNQAAAEYHTLHDAYAQQFGALRSDDTNISADTWIWGTSEFPWRY